MGRHVIKTKIIIRGVCMKLNKKNKGFTLIEILLVVGFIALASVGVYKIYSKVQVSNQANAESRNLDLIRAGVKTLYASQTNYGTAPNIIDNTMINKARIVPEVMNGGVTSGATITNSFGGNVTIAATTLGTGGAANNGFKITYERVPGDICMKLASAAGAQFDQVTVGSDVAKQFGVNTINVANITSGCNGDTGNGVTMIFESL
jgi:prepilin-type N-terminal cleavage/methylation domain-containing protein